MAYVHIKDCKGCIDATIMGRNGWSFLEIYINDTYESYEMDNQTVVHAIRTSIDEEQILYVRATEKGAEGTILKYDIAYMFDSVTELYEHLDPRSAVNNIIEFQPKHTSCNNKGKPIVKPVK
ncbi:hypothetical protein Adt_37497 [Abeliophyllum distichum]|uniref:Uncharacterized protein n=1 Tax=Abeliophyllum distichum TaxID=126358 RepID=A0ABD1QL41_9LAMI